MGSHDFTYLQAGSDMEKALAAAVEQDRYDNGHDCYRGTIGQKAYGVVVITREVLSPKAATDLAYKLISDGDPRIDDKWGPAGAIPVKSETRTVQVKIGAGTVDGDTVKALALEALRKQRKIRRGEKIEQAFLQSYSQPRTPAYSRFGHGYSGTYGQARSFTDAVVTVTLRKGKTALAQQTTADAWLFFGWAAS